MIVLILHIIWLMFSWVGLIVLILVIEWLARRKYGPPVGAPDFPYSELYYSEREIALARDRYTCRVCGGPGNITHHIVPRKRGGADTADNLMTVCAGCHPLVEP